MNLEWMATGSLELVHIDEAERICRVCCADFETVGPPMSVLEVSVGDKHAAFEIHTRPHGEPMVNLKELARFLLKCEEEGLL